MRKIILVLSVFAVIAGCSTLLESDDAAIEMAWELADQLDNRSGLTVAVAEIDSDDVPEPLLATYRDELSTTLAIAFREKGADHIVVTRDRVDSVMREYELELEGLTYGDAQARIGQVLGADVLVTGQIIWLEGDMYRSKSQLIEVSTGVVLGGTTWDFWFVSESTE